MRLCLSELTPRQRIVLTEGASWAIFLSVFVWFYRLLPWMWDAYLPGRGDPFEALWQIEFWRHALLTGEFQPVSLSAMYPLGMHHMTTAHIGISLILAPIALVTGSAVALNIGFIGGLVLCFLGARNFLRHFTASTLLAGIGATIFTFALGRTFHIHFHINIAFASAFGVWMADLLLRLLSALQSIPVRCPVFAVGQRAARLAICACNCPERAPD